MTVPLQVPISAHLGNGVATVFAFDWLLLSPGDMLVTLDGVEQSAGFAVGGVGQQTGGAVTFTVAPADGTRILLVRSTTRARTNTDYQQGGDLFSLVLNRDFDRLWMAVQEIAAGTLSLPNVVRAPLGETLPELPPAAARALKQVTTDAQGNIVFTTPVSGSAADVLIQLAATTGPNGIGFNPTLNYVRGTIGWSEASRREWNCSDQPWNAKFDGVTNDTAAMTACMAALFAAGGGTMVMPGGTAICNLAYNWTASRTVNIRGAGDRATILQSAAASTAPVLDLSADTSILDVHSKFSGFAIRGSASAGPGLRLTTIASFELEHLDIRSCSIAIHARGALVFSGLNVVCWANAVNLKTEKSGIIYPNSWNFRASRFVFATGVSVDIGHASGWNFQTCDFERNGTAGVLTTGAVLLRANVSEETGFATGGFTGACHFERNFGETFKAEASSLALVMETPIILASEAGRALNIGGIQSIVLLGATAPSPADVVTIAAANSTVIGGTIATLNDTSTIRFEQGVNDTTGSRRPKSSLLQVDDLRINPANPVRSTTNLVQGNQMVSFTDAMGAGNSLTVYHANGGNGNAAATFSRFGTNSTTGRSINAGGTVNVAGADYAEYEWKRGDCGAVLPGDVVGFDTDGKLTDKWALAVSFAVKSTSPAVVGGDDWGDGLAGDALESKRQEVDRIAYCGKVPINFNSGTPGQWIDAAQSGDGIGFAVSTSRGPNTVGRVRKALPDGRRQIAVVS